LTTAPDFRLPDTDGTQHSPDGVTAVVFTCNHCPYALAWHERLLAVAADYAHRGVRTLLINPNDAERYPRDSFAAMRERVAAEGPWPAPYLRDEDQSVARAFGAQTTPDVFVLDADLHFTEHPTGSVCAGSGSRPSSTASRAARSQRAFWDSSPWSPSGAPR
jgi:hypothetical protein